MVGQGVGGEIGSSKARERTSLGVSSAVSNTAEKPREARPEGVPGCGNTEVIGGLLGQSHSVRGTHEGRQVRWADSGGDVRIERESWLLGLTTNPTLSSPVGFLGSGSPSVITFQPECCSVAFSPRSSAWDISGTFTSSGTSCSFRYEPPSCLWASVPAQKGCWRL